MADSFGRELRVTIFGASHAESVGVVIEGIPAGVALSPDMFVEDLDRRRPALRGETTRSEEDVPIIEGLTDGRTTGESLTIRFLNRNIRSADYSHLKRHPRPSHADLTQLRKYGEEYDLAGGGRASGRMSVALVAAGVVAKQLIPEMKFQTRLVAVGGCCDAARFDEIIAEAAREGDSVGGIVETRVSGMIPSLGEPFFDSAESVISHLLFSVPAVKGVEFGDGFEGAHKRGSERNDLIISADGRTATNNEGGINGGITNGNELVVRAAIKPTPSIAREQMTYDFERGEVARLMIGGRHDACIARRAAVVVEAMVALALADMKLLKA